MRTRFRPRWKTYVAGAVVAFGFIVMFISMFQSIGKMIQGECFFLLSDLRPPGLGFANHVVLPSMQAVKSLLNARSIACKLGEGAPVCSSWLTSTFCPV